MKKKLLNGIILSAFLGLTVTGAHAAAGEKGGNGGDICEDRIKVIRDDLSVWIKNGGSAGLKLPKGLALAQYNVKMQAEIAQAEMSCTDDTVKIDGAEKTCENFMDSSGTPQIVCNRNEFMNETSDSDQYVLIHHEYAGLAGFEVNDGESSHYVISNQISGFLADQVVKKLVVQPAITGRCACSIGSDEGYPDILINGSDFQDYSSLDDAISAFHQLQNSGICGSAVLSVCTISSDEGYPDILINGSDFQDYSSLDDAINAFHQLQSSGFCGPAVTSTCTISSDEGYPDILINGSDFQDYSSLDDAINALTTLRTNGFCSASACSAASGC